MTDGGGTLFFLADFLEHYIDYYEGKTGEVQIDAAVIADEVRLASDVAFTPNAKPDDFLKAKEITPFKESLFNNTPSQECVTISIPVAEIKALCKQYDVSPFAVIAIFLSRACLKIIDESDETPAVGLMVPVECRRMFETHTFHNFTSIAFIYCENEDLKSAAPSAAAQSFRYQLLQQSEKEDMAHSYTRYHDLRPLLADPEQRETIIKIINGVVHNKTHVTYTHLTHPLYSERVSAYVVSNYCAVCALPQLAYIICAGLTDNENYNLSIPDNMTTSDFFDELFAILDEFDLHYSTKRIRYTYPHLAKFAE